jgi:hypothetical protein
MPRRAATPQVCCRTRPARARDAPIADWATVDVGPRVRGRGAGPGLPLASKIEQSRGLLTRSECASLSPDDAEGSRDEKHPHSPMCGACPTHREHQNRAFEQTVALVVGLADDPCSERIGLCAHTTCYACEGTRNEYP